jgi:hypothetical protein
MTGQKNTKPPFVRTEQTEIYITKSKEENTTACGEGNIDWTVWRLLNTTGKNGNDVSYSLSVGTEIPMLVAGIEKVT